MNTSFEGHVQGAIQKLETARSKLIAEIRNYPTPIAGCDVQFNHLIEERTRISAALGALKTPRFTPTPRQLTA